ncbi:MAG: hypothetical protein IPP71_00320 [Bacteroidetes bacterium]|nr:hypothetical protein [Bacteroidota bacterium]
MGTYIDFTDLLSCDDYWNYTLAMSNVDFEELDNYNFDGGVTYPYTNRKFVVDGNIIVENPGTILLFEGCQLVFKPNNPPYTITVKADATLQLYPFVDTTDPLNEIRIATHLFSCDDMWGGIINEEDGTIDIIAVSAASLPTKIEDADKAIQSDNGDVNIRFANFNNNFIGIELLNYDKTISNLASDKGFLGITFSCSDSILTKPLHPGEQPFANFNLVDVVNVSIGGFGATPATPITYKNKFADAIFGIRSQSSIAKIFNNEFTNIGIKDVICRLCEGAIFATEGSNLTIGGLLTEIPISETISKTAMLALSPEE